MNKLGWMLSINFGLNVALLGSTCFATPPNHNARCGHFRIFEIDTLSTSSTQFAESEGSNNNDEIANMDMVFNSETWNLSSLYSGSSFAPLAPMTSLAPTVNIPVDPLVSTFSCDFEHMGNAEVALSENADTLEIKLC